MYHKLYKIYFKTQQRCVFNNARHFHILLPIDPSYLNETCKLFCLGNQN
jgi:hypothetical protein